MNNIFIPEAISYFAVLPIFFITTGVLLIAIINRESGIILRILAIFLIIFIILDPSIKNQIRTPIEDTVLIITDKSFSQKISNRLQNTERTQKDLIKKLEKLPNTRVKLEYLEQENDFNYNEGTMLFTKIKEIVGLFPRKELSAVIAITDGIAHDAPSPLSSFDLPVPLHVFLTGSKRDKDRRLILNHYPEFNLVGEMAKFSISAEDNALEKGSPIKATIRHQKTKEDNITINNGTTLEFSSLIEQTGPNIVEVSLEESENEVSLENNNIIFSINGVRDRLSVLLISGKPHLGERSWRSLLNSDPNVDLVHFTILRPIEKDDGTPLSELALISFPVQELFEENLYDFDVVIFDRYDHLGLVPFQFMNNVSEYVQMGGALLLSVGPEFAKKTSPFNSPLEQILPALPTGRVYEEPFLPLISKTGKRHPITSSLIPNKNNVPEWGRWLRHIEIEKFSGDELMVGANNAPLLLVDRVKKGRVGLLLSDTIWLWGKGFEGGGPQAEILRRLTHWLMKEPELEEESIRTYIEKEKLVINRRTLKDTVDPITITYPDEKKNNLTLIQKEHGLFSKSIGIQSAGLYQFQDKEISYVTLVGKPNPIEKSILISTEEEMLPFTRNTGGSIFWVEEGSIPIIRKVYPGKTAYGRNWIGIHKKNNFSVNETKTEPLIPKYMALIILLAVSIIAWKKESN